MSTFFISSAASFVYKCQIYACPANGLLKLLGETVVSRSNNNFSMRAIDRNRERKGLAALADGMVALAAGENRVALSRALKAEKLLGKPELTNLMVAQAAEAAGDTARRSRCC